MDVPGVSTVDVSVAPGARNETRAESVVSPFGNFLAPDGKVCAVLQLITTGALERETLPTGAAAVEIC